jgi:hypothetical protein
MRSISRRASAAYRTSRRRPRLTIAPIAAAARAAAALTAALVTACGATASGSGATAPGSRAPAAPGSGTAAGSISGPAQAATAADTASAPAASVGTAPVPGQQPCDPRLIGPVAASFVSAAHGFLLGITLSDCAAHAASKIAVRKTTDGGRHWTSLPAPPAPWGGVAPDGTGRIPADGVTFVLFADDRDGWAYGPGLWATHDGGATWQRVDLAGHAVQMMAASGGQVLASLESCDPADSACDGPHAVRVETSPASRDAWRPVPGAMGEVLSVRAGTGYAVAPGQYGTDVSMFTGPADGSARWVSRRLPCQPGRSR